MPVLFLFPQICEVCSLHGDKRAAIVQWNGACRQWRAAMMPRLNFGRVTLPCALCQRNAARAWVAS